MSSSIKSTACIDDLPWEMIRELFKHLGPEDLIACSMVNKRWHSVYAAFKLHRLVATDDPNWSRTGLIRWQSSNRPIQEAERCRPAIFRHLAEKPLLSNLEHLAVTGSFEFDPNKLNRFSRLVHLEIETPLVGTVHLNLPKLKVLAFHRYNHGCALSIDCPELNTLLYQESNDLLQVKHPETIRKLETDLLGPKLARFKCVESLVTYQLEAIDKATLLSLPALRELRYDVDIAELVEIGFENRIGTLDDIKETVSEFLDEAKRLRGSDFRFTFSGFQLTNVNVDQIDFGLEVDEESGWMGREYIYRECIYMKNYQLIEPGALQFVKHINYTSLLSHVTGEFPRCFSQKFTGIKSVEVDDVVKNPDHLLWFLKSQMFLRNLNLNSSELSQEFYDQLPAVARSLLSLELCGQYEETGLQLNFDFIGQFPRLSSLSIYQALSLRSATSLVRWLGGLKDVFIHVRSGRDLSIQKERDSTVWKVQKTFYRDDRDSPPTEPPLLFETENPSEIANFFEEHRAASPTTGKASD